MDQTIKYTIDLDADQASQSINDLEKELSRLNEEIGDVKVGSDAFNKLSTQIQGVTRELQKADNAIEGMTLDKKIEVADGAIKGFAGSVAAATGALGILGVESETFGKFEEKAASAIAFATGIKDISEGFKQLSKSEAVATIGAKLFGNSMKAAISATGIGLLIVGLVAIAENWDSISKKIGLADDEQEKLNQTTKEYQNILSTNENYWNQEVAKAKAAGKSYKEVNDLRVKGYKDVINEANKVESSLQRELDNLEKGTEAYITKEKERDEASKKIQDLKNQNEIDNLSFQTQLRDEADKKQEEAAKKKEERDKERIANSKAALEKRSDEEVAILERKFEREKTAYDEQREIVKKDLKLDEEDRKALLQKIDDNEYNARQAHLQAVADLAARYNQEIQDLTAITDVDKLALQKQRDLEEIENLKVTQEEKLNLLKLFNEKYAAIEDQKRQDDLIIKSDELLKESEDQELSFQDRLAKITEREGMVSQIIFTNDKERTDWEKANADARENIAKAEAEAKLVTLNGYAGALSTISGVLGQETIAGKALAVASSTINTYAAIAGQLAAFSKVPVPGYAIAQAIATGVAGLAAVKKIISTKVPGSSSGGSAPSLPSLTAGGVAGGNINGAQTPESIRPEPFQTYVLTGDVTSGVEAQARLRQIRTF
jgi:hypothetical protein